MRARRLKSVRGPLLVINCIKETPSRGTLRNGGMA